MSDDAQQAIPIWTISTRDVQAALPTMPEDDQGLSAERVEQFRSALSLLADSPVVTLEAHPLPKFADLSRGMSLDAASPLARHLADLVRQTPRIAQSGNIGAAGETLYRMVVPAKVAAQVGKGLVRPMASTAASGGVHSALVNSVGITAQATFVPVAGSAGVAGTTAAAGAAGAAGAGVLGGTAITVAAPLVLLALAAGASAYADHKRQQAIEHITELLEQLHEDKLDAERNALDGCRGAIDKATAILLDRGQLGISLGLDSAVHAIDTAIAAAERRAKRWREKIDSLPDIPLELSTLQSTFNGIDREGGEFRAHLELAALAIALKRRVLLLQAVEHAQSDADNSFQSFVRCLKSDQQLIDQLEDSINAVCLRLAATEIRSSSRLVDKLVTRGEVDDMLRASYRIRALGAAAAPTEPPTDVAIEIAKGKDGSLIVLPTCAA